MRSERREPLASASVEYAVPFFDLDPMKVVWHGNYLNYFELARDVLFARAGIDFYQYFEDEGIVFPVIRSEAKYVSPLRHRDQIVITADLVEVRRKIVIEFVIRLKSDGQICAKGRTEQAAVSMRDQSLLLRIPEPIQRGLCR